MIDEEIEETEEETEEEEEEATDTILFLSRIMSLKRNLNNAQLELSKAQIIADDLNLMILKDIDTQLEKPDNPGKKENDKIERLYEEWIV